MDLKKEYGQDDTLAQTGAWVPFGGARVLLLPMSHPEVRAFHKAQREKFYLGGRRTELTDEQEEQAILETLVAVICRTWEDLKEDGQVVPYSKEAARRIFTAYPQFALDAVRASSRAATFRAAEVERTLGE